MGSSNTTREALLAELIGDVGTLIDRVNAMQASMETTRRAMADAAWTLDTGVGMFQDQVVAAAKKSKETTVEDVTQTIYRLTRSSMDQQKEAMRESARSIVSDEVGPTLRELAESLKALVARLDRPWEGWLIHVATVGTSVACVYLFQFLSQ